MTETPTYRGSRWRRFWPNVADVSGAEEALSFGVWTTFALAAFAALLSTYALILGGPAAGLLPLASAVWLALLGLGLRKRWRSAAVVGLIAQGMSMVTLIADNSIPSLFVVLSLFGFANAARGIYALRRLQGVPVPPTLNA